MDIILSDISKSFEDKQVISNFNLEIKSGETLCIMGGSGIGKTTVINIILGLTKPDSGKVCGIDKQKFSAVFQEDRLATGFSAIQNIKIAAPNIKEDDIKKDLFLLGLTQEDITKPVSKLSGGMKRRVAIARAMIAQSNVIIMDEPFKGLDNNTKDIVIEYVLAKKGVRTLIVITHDIKEAEHLNGRIFNM